MAKKAKILVLATGGTIAGLAASAENPGEYQPGVMDIQSLLATVPGLGDCADIAGRQIANIGSEDMTDEVWLRLADAAATALADPGVDGIVVLHGTDTMEETAYFLQLVLDVAKPLVVTGAMRPANAVSADGPMNILNAVRLAAHPEAAGRGVLVAMNDLIHAARDVAKTDPHNLDAFQSPAVGPLGAMLDGRPHFLRPSRPTPAGGCFPVAGLSALPEVAILYGHAGQGSWAAEAALKAGARGIVHAGMGNGRVHKNLLPALTEAAGRGVAVVCSTRVGRGIVALDADLEGRGFIAAGDRNPQKARVLLQVALTGNPGTAELRGIFARY